MSPPPTQCLCVCLSHKMERMNTRFPNSISQLAFVIELCCVYCEVGSEVFVCYYMHTAFQLLI